MHGIRLGVNNYAYSPALVGYYGCAQPNNSQRLDDRSRFAAHAAKGTGQTYDAVTGTYGIWGTNFRARSYAHTDATRAPTLPATGVLARYESASDSAIFAIRGEFTRPGSSTPFLRLGSSTVPGVRWNIGGTGTVQWWVYTAEGGVDVQLTNSSIQLAGSGSETIVAVFDGVAKTARMWLNGVEVATIDTLPAGRLFTSATFAGVIGGSSNGSIALSVQELQIYVSNSLPASIYSRASDWHARPYRPFSSVELPA